MGRLGPWELAIILIVALLIFGPAKLPELGRSIGRGISEFRKGIKGLAGEVEEAGKEARQAVQDGER